MATYNDLGDQCSLEAGENPVRKAPLGVTGVDAELIIDEIMGGNDDGGGGGGGGGDYRARHGIQRQEVRLLLSQVLHLRRELADSRAELERRDTVFKHKLTRINTNVARLAATPGRRSLATAGIETGGLESGRNDEGNGGNADLEGQPPIRLVATLSSRPKTLHNLWHEYQNGMSGKKPAREFSDSERGKVKSVYSYRLKFWEKCDEMMRSGLTADIACDKIYEAYGVGTSVTKILDGMKRDKRQGSWHALLQVLAV